MQDKLKILADLIKAQRRVSVKILHDSNRNRDPYGSAYDKGYIAALDEALIAVADLQFFRKALLEQKAEIAGHHAHASRCGESRDTYYYSGAIDGADYVLRCLEQMAERENSRGGAR